MRLVIDIDDKVYEDSKKLVEYGFGSLLYVEAIANGIPYEERANGKWIHDPLHNPVCSVCGGIRRDNRFDHVSYCNKCGARME